MQKKCNSFLRFAAPLFASLIVGGMFTGCAFTPQQANLNPTVTVVGSDIGQGKKIVVQVTDERPTRELGRRGTAYGPAASINTEQDLQELIYDELARGLADNGFQVVPATSQPQAILRAELRHLEYSTSTGFWTGGVHVNGAMKAVGEVDGERYENFYRVGEEKRVMFVPAAGQNEQFISTGLAELISDLLNDTELLRFLAK